MKSISLFLLLIFSLLGNAQWQKINTPRLSQIILETYSPDTFHLGGYNGNFYHSNNGGSSYTKDSIDLYGGWLLDMEFINANVGYACGGTAFGNYTSPILKTLDGGVTWDTLITNRLGYDLHCLDVLDAQTVYVGGSGILVKTTDGGATFTVDTLGLGNIYDIHFFNNMVGLAVFDKKIHRTTDGGISWNVVLNDTSSRSVWQTGKMEFPNQSGTCYYVNSVGNLYTSINNGLSWTYITRISSDFWISDISFPSNMVGYVTTSDPLNFHNSGNILGTQDGGLTWTNLARSDTGSFAGISMATETEGYAVTYSGVYKTTNGGGLRLPAIKIQEVAIYPNPAKNYLALNVDIKNLERLTILDAQGRLVKAVEIDGKKIDVSGLSPGIYFLKLSFINGSNQVHKIVVE